MSLRNNTFLLLELLLFNYLLIFSVQKVPNETIILDKKNYAPILITSQILTIQNNYKGSENFLLIDISQNNDKNLNLYVTDKSNFNPKKDKYYLDTEKKSIKRLLLLKDNFKKFFLHIKCPNTCKELIINFEFTNNIDINNNENYSFDTKNKKYNFKVKLNFGKIKKVYFALILTGKNIIKGTSMKIGNIQAKGLLKYSLVLFENQNRLNSTLVDINLKMAGEIKIIFKIYENKNNINKIELNKNDFYFLVPKKK